MDWLSRLLDMLPVRGWLELRCLYGAPWRVVYEPSPAGEMPYHVILRGAAVVEDPAGGPPQRLGAGDILLLPDGAAHALHDGSGATPAPALKRAGLNLTFDENAGTGERLDMLCGRFAVAPPHDRLLRAYLPARLVVRGAVQTPSAAAIAAQLSGLVALMRAEADAESLGGRAMLNAFSAALFALALRLASATEAPPPGLLALAGHPRLAPLLAAMLQDLAHPWTLPELARLCHMSRATLVRHVQERLGRPIGELLLDLRMTHAANLLQASEASTGAVAEAAGYQSEAAFQRVFKQRMGATPAQWRRAAHAAVRDRG